MSLIGLNQSPVQCLAIWSMSGRNYAVPGGGPNNALDCVE